MLSLTDRDAITAGLTARYPLGGVYEFSQQLRRIVPKRFCDLAELDHI